jgi:hypothetical protein
MEIIINIGFIYFVDHVIHMHENYIIFIKLEDKKLSSQVKLANKYSSNKLLQIFLVNNII